MATLSQDSGLRNRHHCFILGSDNCINGFDTNMELECLVLRSGILVVVVWAWVAWIVIGGDGWRMIVWDSANQVKIVKVYHEASDSGCPM